MGENQTANDYLVYGGECGSCAGCCKALKINVPELKKMAGVLCEQCKEGGVRNI